MTGFHMKLISGPTDYKPLYQHGIFFMTKNKMGFNVRKTYLVVTFFYISLNQPQILANIF